MFTNCDAITIYEKTVGADGFPAYLAHSIRMVYWEQCEIVSRDWSSDVCSSDLKKHNDTKSQHLSGNSGGFSVRLFAQAW